MREEAEMTTPASEDPVIPVTVGGPIAEGVGMRIRRPRRGGGARRGVVALVLVTGIQMTLGSPASAQDRTRPRIDAETARELLASRARGGGWWVASNAEHRTRDDRVPDYYAMRYELVPGGFASTGCMWGGRDGEPLGPFWTFLSAWDPVEEALLLYQVNSAGAVAIGHGWPGDGSAADEVAIQQIVAPGQPSARIRHLSTLSHPDTLRTRSFDWRDGTWMPRREDVWVWTPAEGREPPVC